MQIFPVNVWIVLYRQLSTFFKSILSLYTFLCSCVSKVVLLFLLLRLWRNPLQKQTGKLHPQSLCQITAKTKLRLQSDFAHYVSSASGGKESQRGEFVLKGPWALTLLYIYTNSNTCRDSFNSRTEGSMSGFRRNGWTVFSTCNQDRREEPRGSINGEYVCMLSASLPPCPFITEALHFQQKLDETTKLLRDLQEAQKERLSAKQPPNMICLLAPTAKELELGKSLSVHRSLCSSAQAIATSCRPQTTLHLPF